MLKSYGICFLATLNYFVVEPIILFMTSVENKKINTGKSDHMDKAIAK